MNYFIHRWRELWSLILVSRLKVFEFYPTNEAGDTRLAYNICCLNVIKIPVDYDNKAVNNAILDFKLFYNAVDEGENYWRADENILSTSYQFSLIHPSFGNFKHQQL